MLNSSEENTSHRTESADTLPLPADEVKARSTQKSDMFWFDGNKVHSKLSTFLVC